ncbi:MAG TPA: hypothetical protein VGN16_12825 [Acidobacteriaceae bacterium]|jgi:hypothetical protein
MKTFRLLSLAALLCLCATAFAQTEKPAEKPAAPAPAQPAKLTAGSAVFIEPMDGFDSFLAAALIKKQVPLRIVDDKTKADFIITGSAKEEKAGWAKTIFVSPAPHAQASISVKDEKTGDLVYAYNVDKSSSARGNQSTAEACAKHLKQEIERK